MSYFYKQFKDSQFTASFSSQADLYLLAKSLNPKSIFSQAGNALTVRLVLLQENLISLFDQQERISGLSAAEYQLDNSSLPKWQYMQLASSGTDPEYSGLEIDEFEIQKHLYSYFNNYCSILDRIAIELNEIYKIGQNISVVDFRNIQIDRILSKNTHLWKLIKDSKRYFDRNRIFDYRDVLSHQGLIQIKIPLQGVKSGFITEKIIYLKSNPRSKFSHYNIKMSLFCRENFDYLVNFCDSVYAHCIKNLKENNKYPIN